MKKIILGLAIVLGNLSFAQAKAGEHKIIHCANNEATTVDIYEHRLNEDMAVWSASIDIESTGDSRQLFKYTNLDDEVGPEKPYTMQFANQDFTLKLVESGSSFSGAKVEVPELGVDEPLECSWID